MMKFRNIKRYAMTLSIFAVVPTVSISGYISIDLSKQMLYFYEKEGTKPILSTYISSGNRLHQTPVGKYHVLNKERYHKSNRYPIRKNGARGGAKMDFMLKITKSGIAIHQGNVLFEKREDDGVIRSIPASHGCIRVQKGVAEKLFHLVKVGDRVIINGKSSFKNHFNDRLMKNDRLKAPQLRHSPFIEPQRWVDESNLNLTITRGYREKKELNHNSASTLVF
jgi:hypothetical protein